ncbi:class I adenylate-forming enzyme family protein [Aeromicrobium wangtongii]|uniref:class I adenylate-forming enzyme family protein n=1 Tax=Aeromicrobium wangtongii TaxID=2969247 RepID=UPI002017C5A0|nr:AMP-binding protein [Aeromicrobium wangtongii]MCL3819856.1 AMP-binding protein [Aeromicrobium wangtongii]
MDQIGNLLVDAADQHPRRIALKTGDGFELSYAEFDNRTTRLANALLDQGFAPGDRIAAWLGTCPQYFELYFAIAKAGLVLVPVNILFTRHEADYQVKDSGAVALFHAESRREEAEVLAQQHGLRRLVPIGDWNSRDTEYEQLLLAGSADLPTPPDPDSLYILSYTSGTTGRPKGAMVTHRSLKSTARNHAHSYRTPQGSVLIYYANMSFVATVLGLMMGHVFVRGTIVMVPGINGPAEALDMIEQEQGTFTFVPSPWLEPMSDLMEAHPEKWQQMRSFVHSASKAPASQLQRWASIVGHRYLEGWGMTEGSGSLFTVTDVDDVVNGSKAQDFYASTGRPCIDVSVRVIDGTGVELPRDGITIGELEVKSPAMVVGYWNNEDATRKSFVDGWFRTGDLGAIDPEGYVYVTERRTDLIVSGGMNVYPSEIEYCIAELADVQEVAVVGTPHERWGEAPVAFIVVRSGAVVTEADVIEHCSAYLARYKRPSQIHFIEELPRNASQKVLRRVLRERLDAQ